MREVEIDDVFAALVPEGFDLDEVKDRLSVEVQAQVWRQWREDRPLEIRFEPINWLMTQDPDEVERFQPAHECEVCRTGNEHIRTFLTANPDRWVVLGNMHYVEVWAE